MFNSFCITENIYQLVDDAAFTCKLRDFVLEHGFIKDHYGSRTVVIGVDVRYAYNISDHSSIA